jgi:hypothetical protein
VPLVPSRCGLAGLVWIQVWRVRSDRFAIIPETARAIPCKITRSFSRALVPLSQWSDVRCGGALDFASSEQRYITRIAIGERDRSYVGPRERILSRLIEKLRGSFRPSTVRTAERACVWRIADSGRMRC